LFFLCECSDFSRSATKPLGTEAIVVLRQGPLMLFEITQELPLLL